jgi:hypothetical protein
MALCSVCCSDNCSNRPASDKDLVDALCSILGDLKIKSPASTFKAMLITVVILVLITVVAYFARQKVTSWRTYAAQSEAVQEHTTSRREPSFGKVAATYAAQIDEVARRVSENVASEL